LVFVSALIRKMNIYGLGVGISIVFEIFSQFPISGEWGYPIPKAAEGQET
jgi:hypothetical protein